jgi:hypothetical protein
VHHVHVGDRLGGFDNFYYLFSHEDSGTASPSRTICASCPRCSGWSRRVPAPQRVLVRVRDRRLVAAEPELEPQRGASWDRYAELSAQYQNTKSDNDIPLSELHIGALP